MSARGLLRAAAVAAVLAALWGAAGTASAQQDQGQRFFEQRLLADRQTSSAIKTLLRSGGGFVDGGVGFHDLTGDKRDDAIVRVQSGGAAGAVAVYVFSTANRKGGKLRVIFRSQSLMRASTHVSRGVLSYTTARYDPGDELCCPARLSQSTLGWSRRERRLRVRERVTFEPPPEAQAPAAPWPGRGAPSPARAASRRRPAPRRRGRRPVRRPGGSALR